MAKIAYVDHSFHKKTLSTSFLSKILVKNGHQVDLFWDEQWCGGSRVNWKDVCQYDVVIMFQAFCDTNGRPFGRLHHNVIYIPMLDQFGLWTGKKDNVAKFFKNFEGTKILSFSSAIHTLALSLNIPSLSVRYFQPPIIKSRDGVVGLHGFFWTRRNDDISWGLIRKLIEGTHFDSFHIHLTNDPGTSTPEMPTTEEVKKYNITTSMWFETKSEYEETLGRANVFFAPRLGEGIGQSFLEAMSRGQCVVAANQGTMNEYIISGINGILYEHTNPSALDFKDVHHICDTALKTVKIGYATWLESENRLLDFIMRPTHEKPAAHHQIHKLWRSIKRS